MTLGLFFPFQMFPTELLKGEVGTDLGSLQTKKVNHDRTTNRQRTLHHEQPDTFFSLLKKMFLAHASSKFPLLFVFIQEETSSQKGTLYLVLSEGTIILLTKTDAAS